MTNAMGMAEESEDKPVKKKRVYTEEQKARLKEYQKNNKKKRIYIEEQRLAKKAKKKAYDQSEVQKAKRRVYNQTDKGKAISRAYALSKEGKEKQKAYSQSERWKAKKKAYDQTEERKAKLKAYRESEEQRAYQKAYSQSASIKEYHKAYKKERYANDFNFKMCKIVRGNLHRMTKRGFTKTQSSIKYINYTHEEFKTHMESLFMEGMTWDNWTFEGWHVDHIRPLASFVFIEGDDEGNKQKMIEANSLENLQPLWATDNFSKGDRYEAA